jgi:hypothetical protein
MWAPRVLLEWAVHRHLYVWGRGLIISGLCQCVMLVPFHLLIVQRHRSQIMAQPVRFKSGCVM